MSADEKSYLRKLYIETRNAIPSEIIENKSQMIAKTLFETAYYKKCLKLFIFLDMGSEVKTREIIKCALSEGKEVGIPYAKPKSREMVFIKINDLDSLVKSTYGALEPVYDEKKILSCDHDTIIIVPGNVFDAEGYRIGYGGGYYDTYIEKNKSMANIGLCFEEQICEAVPREAHDRRLDMLISDRRMSLWKH